MQIPLRIPLLLFKLQTCSQLWCQDGVQQFLFLFFQKVWSAHKQDEEEGDGEYGEENLAQEEEESSNE